MPTVPGYLGDDQSTAALVAAAQTIGFPLLVKASAGGGGKGMRIVRQAGELVEAIDRARGEAGSAFGDDTLLLERYIERPRHIEIQILGDSYGHVVHLWERECSIQRRHQKVIEEAPSPALDPERRAAMGRAAVELGRAVGYVGAGTVEFITDPGDPGDPRGAFYFLEVNTRLQVEHPVTELTTGLDLVREQIRIARGEPLGYDAAPAQRGWAIEVRLCAEDPERDYLPTTGALLAVDVPVQGGAEAGTVRADLGVAAGSEVGIHYDSMLGKIIAHGATRRDAAQLLRRALDQTWVPGLVTNREHLARILGHPAFLAGELDTHFLDRHAGELAARSPGARPDPRRRDRRHPARDRAAPRAAPPARLGRARAAGLAQRAVRRPAGHLQARRRRRDRRVPPDRGRDRRTAEIEHRRSAASRPGCRGSGSTAIGVWFVEHGGHRRTLRVARAGARAWVLADGQSFALVEQPRFAEPGADAVAGGLTAPMPGKVVRVLVTPGQEVAANAPLVVLEAMKMEHTVRAAAAGTVRAIHVAVGDQVDGDRVLAVVTA